MSAAVATPIEPTPVAPIEAAVPAVEEAAPAVATVESTVEEVAAPVVAPTKAATPKRSPFADLKNKYFAPKVSRARSCSARNGIQWHSTADPLSSVFFIFHLILRADGERECGERGVGDGLVRMVLVRVGLVAREGRTGRIYLDVD